MTLSSYHESISHPHLLEARRQARELGIPPKAVQAYRNQFNNAQRRRIEWCFTIPEWWAWWQEFDPRHGCIRWERRGRNQAGCLMMGRFKDLGPYSPDNVYCATAADNQGDTSEHYNFSAPAKKWHSENDSPLKGRRGDHHPKSRAVITESGRFGSISLASEAAGITRQAGYYRVQRGVWHYETGRSPS